MSSKSTPSKLKLRANWAFEDLPDTLHLDVKRLIEDPSSPVEDGVDFSKTKQRRHRHVDAKDDEASEPVWL